MSRHDDGQSLGTNGLPIQHAESLPDEELVRRCWKELPGNSVAFNLLVKRYKEYVFRIALSKVSRIEDAEDAAQETFVRVFFGIRKFRLDSTFKTWLTRIAINVCLTMVLSQKGIFWRSYVSLEGDPDIETLYNSLVTTHQEKQFWSTVGGVLRNMFQDYRKIFILRFFKNRSLDQLRSQFDASLGAVKMRIKRAKEQFISILKDS